MDARGLVLTCWHVVEDQSEIQVTLSDGSEHRARVRGYDAKLDVALLQIDAQGLAVAQAGDAHALEAGDDVFALGAPRKMAFSISRGMVSFAERDVEGVRYLQTDLPLNPGNSGGPVVNASGEVVGLASFVLRESQGISFALPIRYAQERFATLLAAPDAALAPRGPAPVAAKKP